MWIRCQRKRNFKKSPYFNIIVWNCCKISKRQEAKTNNLIED